MLYRKVQRAERLNKWHNSADHEHDISESVLRTRVNHGLLPIYNIREHSYKTQQKQNEKIVGIMLLAITHIYVLTR